MTTEEKHKQERFARIRRVKRFLRPLPRKANIHRYPFLKWFANTARMRAYLWSFRKENVIPAIYSGTILSLLPLYGIQIPLAFLCALVFRGNLMILAALQFITNPFTIVPVYAFTYKVGDWIIGLFAAEPMTANELSEIAEETGKTIASGALHSGMMFFLKLCVGGVIVGYITALIISLVYQWTLKRGYKYRLHPLKPADQEKVPTETDKKDD